MTAGEIATYDSGGRVTSLIHDGAKVPITGQLMLVMTDGREINLQPHDQRSPIERERNTLHWTGRPRGEETSSLHFSAQWEEVDGALNLVASLRTSEELDIRAVRYRLALPRERFLGGRVSPGQTPLGAVRPTDGVVLVEPLRGVTVADTQDNWTVSATFDRERTVRVTDEWHRRGGRTYMVGVELHAGEWRPEEEIEFSMSLRLDGEAPPSKASLIVDDQTARQRFIGFGGNYCWSNLAPASAYTVEHLNSAWARFHLDFRRWHAERANPGESLRRDFELMSLMHEREIPWILSIWRTPPEFYVPPPEGVPAPRFGKKIAPEKWDEFLTLIGDYIAYVKEHYGTEPAMFSFNEPDLGVDIGFSAEEHRDVIKEIGTYFERRGFRTKMLLGDTANPRDSHRYVLPAANDPEAMRHVAGVSFHSWGGATEEQYAAWGEVAAWLNLPLFVGEAGMDPTAWRNQSYDSYDYGLREMEDHFNFINQARVQVSLYWEFTNDYGLVQPAAGGGRDHDEAVEPTSRFWMMKHLTNLTPVDCEVVSTSSDTPAVRIMGFRRDALRVVHLLNTGPETVVTLEGLAAGQWTSITTTEEEDWKTDQLNVTTAGRNPVMTLPARSFVTLLLQPAVD